MRASREDEMVEHATRPRTEEIRVTGDQLIATARRIVHEGNVRRLIIKNDEGKTLIEVPLTVGLIGVAILPVWAAIGAIAALATDCVIVVEREEES